MAPSFRKHWKSVYQAKQNLYGLPFKTNKKKWAWANPSHDFIGKKFNQLKIERNSFPFKFEPAKLLNSSSVTNALPRSLRLLAPIRRDYGFCLRSKQAVKASEGLIPEKRFKSLVSNFKYRSGGK